MVVAIIAAVVSAALISAFLVKSIIKSEVSAQAQNQPPQLVETVVTRSDSSQCSAPAVLGAQTGQQNASVTTTSQYQSMLYGAADEGTNGNGPNESNTVVQEVIYKVYKNSNNSYAVHKDYSTKVKVDDSFNIDESFNKGSYNSDDDKLVVNKITNDSFNQDSYNQDSYNKELEYDKVTNINSNNEVRDSYNTDVTVKKEENTALINDSFNQDNDTINDIDVDKSKEWNKNIVKANKSLVLAKQDI